MKTRNSNDKSFICDQKRFKRICVYGFVTESLSKRSLVTQLREGKSFTWF
jgi:hypothetical protein